MSKFNNPAATWLQLAETGEPGLFRHTFHDRHVGNTFIRSIHGGVTAGITELSAEMAVLQEIGDGPRLVVSGSHINYLRATKDHDIHAKAEIIRITRRAAFVDVTCWQEDPDAPVTKGTCTLQIFRD